MPEGSKTPWSYIFVRLLFQFVLKIFFGTIVVENTENIPKTGRPCIVCANHGNSLTDALLLVVTVPPRIRNMLRLTAKATQFGRKTFTSWLIESAGTVPIQRRKDSADGTIDNSNVMIKLMEALELGDAVCVFPEGGSRYHPTIAPLKTGVARMVSDVLSRNREDPDFEMSILTVSITYMHRQHFRSDVLVTFNAPLVFRVKDHPELLSPVDFGEIRTLTAKMHEAISGNTVDAPSWDVVVAARLATRLYAPLGTRMSLGDYVRVTRTFAEAFKAASASDDNNDSPDGDDAQRATEDAEIQTLQRDLKLYQDELSHYGIKDDRVRRGYSRPHILQRLLTRIPLLFGLLVLCIPGLMLWLPVFGITFYAVHNFKKSGPVWDTFDEIAQYKLIYGLLGGIGVWFTATIVTFPIAPFTFFAVPILMWMTLRWVEDAASNARAIYALTNLLRAGPKRLNALLARRKYLHQGVVELAVKTLGLPDDPERHFIEKDINVNEKGRIRSKWQSGAKYFSVRRRRKRDWNETLRLYDIVDYQQDIDPTI